MWGTGDAHPRIQSSEFGGSANALRKIRLFRKYRYSAVLYRIVVANNLLCRTCIVHTQLTQLSYLN